MCSPTTLIQTATRRVDGIGPPRHGSVFPNGDGSLRYRPDPDYTGTDHFRYWASDAQADFTPATVTIWSAPR